MPWFRSPPEDNVFDFLDDSDRAAMRRWFSDLSKASVAKQLAVGGLTGWCSGFLFGRVGKAAALAVGGSLLIIQIAHHQGYIDVNWGKIDGNIKRAKQRLQDANQDMSRIRAKARVFIHDNMFLAGGFAGGFLIGIAS